MTTPDCEPRLADDAAPLDETNLLLDATSIVPELLLGDNLFNHFSLIVRGQPDAIREVARVVRRCERGQLGKFGRPKAAMIFFGGTGVGKTETVKALATALYGEAGEAHLLRLDMAEYQADHSVGVLIGRNRDEQGILGDGIDRLNSIGGGILLLDEIEKAHPSFQTLFLGATDDARLSMTNGETKNLSWIYIIMTSNLGSADAIRMEKSPPSAVERHVLREAEKHFRPEMLARLSLKLVFRRLTYDAQIDICRDILRKEIAHIVRSLSDLGRVPVKIAPSTEKVLEFLVRRGYHKTLGARPMRGVVERELGDAVTDWLDAPGNSLLGLAQTGQVLEFSVQGDTLALATVDAPTATTAPLP